MTWSKEKRRRKEVKYSAVVGIATAAAKETDWETRLSSAVQCASSKQQAVGPYKAIHRIDKRQRDSEQAESRCLEAPDAVALAFAARCRCDRGPTIGRWPHTQISSLFSPLGFIVDIFYSSRFYLLIYHYLLHSALSPRKGNARSFFSSSAAAPMGEWQWQWWRYGRQSLFICDDKNNKKKKERKKKTMIACTCDKKTKR